MENSELFEQLTDAGFTSYGEINDLTADTILKEDIFEHLFSIDNPIKREQQLAKLEQKAKELNVRNNFYKEVIDTGIVKESMYNGYGTFIFNK